MPMICMTWCSSTGKLGTDQLVRVAGLVVSLVIRKVESPLVLRRLMIERVA